jgi:hypothetical protein
MKRNMIRLTLGLAAMCVVVMGLQSQADARLFGRRGGGSWGGWGGGHHGCHSHHSGCGEVQTSCCEEQVVQHDCGGCQSDCHSDCGCNGHHGRRGLFGRRHHGHHGGCGCDSGCDSGCGGCNGAVSGGEVIIDEGAAPSPAPAQNGTPAPAAPEAPPANGEQQDGQQGEQQGEQQEAPSA